MNNLSFKSRIIYKTLDLVSAKDIVFRFLLKNAGKGKSAVSVNSFSNNFQVQEEFIDGFSMLTVTGSSSSNKHIIFLHGGAYLAKAMKGHKKLIEKLVGKYNYKVSFLDYPLAPENNAIGTNRMVIKSYAKLFQDNPGDEFYLLGDSAGGGLALTLLQSLRDKNATNMPTKTILLSPWLDISMTNPEIRDQISKDVLLQFDGLKECGKLYAGNLELTDPAVSPIYSNLDNLGEIIVFVSSHELLYPDCMLLKSKTESVEGTSMVISVKNNMPHDWVIFPIRESDETIKELSAYIGS